MTLTSFSLYLSLCLYVYKTTRSHSPRSLALINNPLNGFQWRVCVWKCVHLTCCLLALEHGNQWSISSPVERPEETVDAVSHSVYEGNIAFSKSGLIGHLCDSMCCPHCTWFFKLLLPFEHEYLQRWIWITTANITIWGEVWGQ